MNIFVMSSSTLCSDDVIRVIGALCSLDNSKSMTFQTNPRSQDPLMNITTVYLL